MDWVALALIACRSPDPPADGSPSHPSHPTGGPTATVDCAPVAGNALRIACDVDVQPAAAVELRYHSDVDPEVIRASADARGAHRVILYDLAPETAYAWELRLNGSADPLETGEFRTERVPDDLTIRFVADNVSPAPDDLLFQFGCGVRPYAVVTDATGTVRWYQDLAEDLPGAIHTAEALTLTPERTVLAIVDRSVVREYDLEGTLLADWRPGDVVGRPIHHDVARRDGVTWVLDAKEAVYPGDDASYVSDGVLALDGHGEVVGSWDLDGVVTPQGGGPPPAYWQTAFPDADVDWSHGNGLWVGEDGVAWVSFYFLDAVLELDLAPSSDDFGALRSALVGHPASPIADLRDYVLTSDVTDDLSFSGQHHPQILSDGRMLLLDNGFFEDARAIALSLDRKAGTATIDAVYDLGLPCPFGGGVAPLSNGNLLATCAPTARLFEFDPDVSRPIHKTQVECVVGTTPTLPRAIPMAW